MNIPIRRVAVACAILLYTTLAHLTHLQAFKAGTLQSDPRDPRHTHPARGLP